MSTHADALRARLLAQLPDYVREAFPARPFVPGETPVPVSGKVFDAEELTLLVDSALDFWLTTGRFAAEFETAFARFMGVRSASLVNSGSSANLLAISALSGSSRTTASRVENFSPRAALLTMILLS